MLNRKMTSVLAMTLAAGSISALSAFAAEPAAPVAGRMKAAVVSAAQGDAAGRAMQIPDGEAGADGGQYFEMETGEKVYFVSVMDADGTAQDGRGMVTVRAAESVADGDETTGLQTDENGQYMVTVDGERVYFSITGGEAKTGPNGAYIDTEDGGKVYISLAEDAAAG